MIEWSLTSAGSSASFVSGEDTVSNWTEVLASSSVVNVIVASNALADADTPLMAGAVVSGAAFVVKFFGMSGVKADVFPAGSVDWAR